MLLCPLDAKCDASNNTDSTPEGPFSFMYADGYSIFNDDDDYTGVVAQWPGSIVLAHCLLHCYGADQDNQHASATDCQHHHPLVRLLPAASESSLAAIELGAGSSGWPSLALLESGRWSALVATDGNATVLSSDELANHPAITRRTLTWGDDVGAAAIMSGRKAKFDLVVAAEVLYALWRECFQAIIRTASQLLSERPRACVLIQVSRTRLDDFSLETCLALGRAAGFELKLNLLTHAELFPADDNKAHSTSTTTAACTAEKPPAVSTAARVPGAGGPNALAGLTAAFRNRKEWEAEHCELRGCILVVRFECTRAREEESAAASLIENELG